MTAGGEDAQMEKAKKVVIWVVVGIILILGSYAIVNTFQKANLGAPGGRQELQESFFSDKFFT